MTALHIVPNQITVERITRADGSQFSAARVSRDRQHLASYPVWLNDHNMPSTAQVMADARWQFPAVVIRTDADGSTAYYSFPNAAKARAFCREEVKWESTARVQCAPLGIDEPGDFA